MPIVEDHVNKDLLFVGTEFGLFFTIDGGKQWVPLRGGVPTIAFRDLAIQRRESDLVGATFGRGFFILDDYTPLRHLTPETLAKEGVLFPPRKAALYNERTYVRAAGNAITPNPPFGAVFTYYLREDLTGKAGRADAKIVLTVTDAGGKTVRQTNGPTTAGLHRVSWDLRVGEEGRGPRGRDSRPLVKPGKFKVSLGILVKDVLTPLGEPQEFEVVRTASAPE